MLPQTNINVLPCDDQNNTDDEEINVDDVCELDDIDLDDYYSQFIDELFNESDDEEFLGFDDVDMC